MQPLLKTANVIAAVWTLAPLLAAAFFLPAVVRWVERLPGSAKVVAPGLLCAAYVLVALQGGVFRWGWLGLYAGLPVGIAGLMAWARRVDPGQGSSWRELLVLALLGLAVDLRWFERAWPPHLAAFSKILLLDAGIYGLLVVRRLDGVGFDLRLRWRDWAVGLREFAWYAPLAMGAGLALGFLHLHAEWPAPGRAAGAFGFTFLLIAVPEELFFRGWMQNLLERRMGQGWALVCTSILFGLSHFNKRAVHFNWRYVLLAALAGVAYGRAWRAERRVGASAITHTCVDTVWSLWLR